MVYESVDKEDIILICFDPNNEIDYLKKRLNGINDNVIFYTEIELCITFIQSVDQKKIFLVIPSSQISSQFINLQQIHSIFIFCFNNELNKYLFIQNPKVIGIYDNINSLCSSIQEQINFITKQISLWCIFDQNKYAAMDLSRHSSNFVWLQLLHDVLLYLPHNKQAKRQMIETCRYYYEDYPEELLLIDELEQKYQSKDALCWFMKSSFLQDIIHKALQMEHSVLLYMLRYFLADLLKNLAHQQTIQSKREKLTVYRQMKLSNDELTQLLDKQGQLISMKEFLIANTDRSPVLSLPTSSEGQTEFISVLFEIECNTKELDNSLIFADISQLTELSPKGTILFDFNTTFRIETIQQDEQIWIIKLIAVNDGRFILQKYINDTYRQIEDLSISIMFGKLLCDMSEWNQSQEYLKQLMNDSPDEDVAWIEYYIGQTYFWQGKWRKSRQYYDHAYSRMMKTKSLRIKDSAHVLYSIGDILCCNGNYEKASGFYKRAFTIQKKYYDSRHPLIASSLDNIGLDHFRQRKDDKALDLFQQALEIREEYYNCSHIDIAESLVHIGNVLSYEGKYDEALEHYRQGISIYEKYYPSDHALIASISNDIGRVLCNTKKYNEAIDIVERALRIKKKLYPYGHINITNGLYTIGFIKYRQQKYDESLELYQHVLIIQNKSFFHGHLDIVRTLSSIGIVQAQGKGNYEEAFRYLQQALTMLKTDYPSYTMHIVTTLQYFGHILRDQMKNDEALVLYRRVLKMQENFYLHDHDDMLPVLTNIGIILSNQEKYDEALVYHRRALTIGEKYCPPYHMNIIVNHLSAIGYITWKQRKFGEAFYYYNRALVILEKYYPMDYTEIVSCLETIAIILYKKSEYSRAIEYTERCLRIKEASLPKERSSIIRNLLDLGLLQRLCRQYDLSLTYELKCLSLSEEILPPNHQDIGKNLFNIGVCYEQLNQIKTAFEYYKQALIIYEQCLPFGHADRENLQLKIEQINI